MRSLPSSLWWNTAAMWKLKPHVTVDANRQKGRTHSLIGWVHYIVRMKPNSRPGLIRDLGCMRRNTIIFYIRVYVIKFCCTFHQAANYDFYISLSGICCDTLDSYEFPVFKSSVADAKAAKLSAQPAPEVVASAEILPRQDSAIMVPMSNLSLGVGLSTYQYFHILKTVVSR